MTTEGSSAASRWRAALESWAIPPDILAAAPRSPYGFSVALFERAARDAPDRRSPTVDAVAAAFPPGGTLLDIGCGAGAASLPVAGTAGLLIGVDESADMLEAFATQAAEAGPEVTLHAGRWPDVADAVGMADVAVARNVAYNVPDLGDFAVAMSVHARSRAVLELSVRHPLHWMNPLWRAIHGVERPDAPTIDDAVAVLEECGLAPRVERWAGPALLAQVPIDEMVDFAAQRLCVGEDRAHDVRAALESAPPPVEQLTATVWWDGAA